MGEVRGVRWRTDGGRRSAGTAAGDDQWEISSRPCCTRQCLIPPAEQCDASTALHLHIQPPPPTTSGLFIYCGLDVQNILDTPLVSFLNCDSRLTAAALEGVDPLDLIPTSPGLPIPPPPLCSC